MTEAERRGMEGTAYFAKVHGFHSFRSERRTDRG